MGFWIDSLVPGGNYVRAWQLSCKSRSEHGSHQEWHQWLETWYVPLRRYLLDRWWGCLGTGEMLVLKGLLWCRVFQHLRGPRLSWSAHITTASPKMSRTWVAHSMPSKNSLVGSWKQTRPVEIAAWICVVLFVRFWQSLSRVMRGLCIWGAHSFSFPEPLGQLASLRRSKMRWNDKTHKHLLTLIDCQGGSAWIADCKSRTSSCCCKLYWEAWAPNSPWLSFYLPSMNNTNRRPRKPMAGFV